MGFFATRDKGTSEITEAFIAPAGAAIRPMLMKSEVAGTWVEYITPVWVQVKPESVRWFDADGNELLATEQGINRS
jgi:hypothetical protein